MKIPSEIQIAGRTYKIEYDENHDTDQGYNATLIVDRCKIVLQPDCKGHKRDKQSLEISFLHEIIHAISRATGDRQLYENEKFTEQWAELLYQVIKQIENNKCK
jgi:hypothetical protein